jgi:hypothetical protein
MNYSKHGRKVDEAWDALKEAFGCVECEESLTKEVWKLHQVKQFHPLDKWLFTFRHRNYNGLGPKEFLVEL